MLTRDGVQGVNKEPRRYPIKPTIQGDLDFIATLETQVTEWYSRTEDASLSLSPMNAFKRLLAYQTLEGLTLAGNGWPGFYLEKAGSDYMAGLTVTRATPQEAAAHKAERRELHIQEIQVSTRAWDFASSAGVLCMYVCM